MIKLTQVVRGGEERSVYLRADDIRAVHEAANGGAIVFWCNGVRENDYIVTEKADEVSRAVEEELRCK
jgi:hypothetical protein